MSVARRAVEVHGLVQGVGFRPFVHGLAARLNLGGCVYNASGGVHIEIEGEEAAIIAFLGELRDRPPAPARIADIAVEVALPRGDRGFHIESSERDGSGTVVIPPDRATCDACLAELVDPTNRRHGHPFVNCTDCGPRATILTGMPYDRERTSMRGFPLCPACEVEYADPTDRRYHAQPVACSACGPRLALLDRAGTVVPTAAPLAEFARVIAGGGIGAVKGIGGFHLTCDAGNARAVGELRRRKHRDAKAFAVMVPDLHAAEALVPLTATARAALCSPARPVVVVPFDGSRHLAEAVAPGVHSLGLLLPYTPVHHLLLAALGGRPLVMTSGNVSEEPIACTDAEARASLAGLVDAFLTHDRPIELRMEDSVVRAAENAVQPVRRARGYSPLPLSLGFDCTEPVLALGGHLKAAFALGARGNAVLGPHLGDLGGARAYAAYADSVRRFEEMLRIEPRMLVHDLHPDYATTRYAEERVRLRPELERVAVQHHHAHLASCMAEHRLEGRVIGVCFDGSGHGEDGTLWGGEFLLGGYAGYARAAHLSEIPLPGGDRAAREPHRVALAALGVAGLPASSAGLARRLAPGRTEALARLAASTLCARTTSMGRLFDAVACLVAQVDTTSYEGEAAMRLEALARGVSADGAYDVALGGDAPFVVDSSPIVHGVVEDLERGTDPGVVARRFHSTVVELVHAACTRISSESGVARVVLTGGVFMNAILSREVPERLVRAGLTVFEHREVPANDGGLCLGQLAVAAHGGGHRLPRSSSEVH